jgi:chromosome segregation ATPase
MENKIMTDVMEKYVAKALEGYEQNYTGITEAIEQMEAQLADYKEKQQEMLDGIAEMKDALGLKDEPMLKVVEEAAE